MKRERNRDSDDFRVIRDGDVFLISATQVLTQVLIIFLGFFSIF